MKTTRIKLSALHNEEWLGFYADLKRVATFFGVDALGIADWYQKILPLYEEADRLTLLIKKSIYTEEIEKADEKRDNLFRGVREVVRGSLQQPDEPKRKAAGRLFNLLEAYKKIIPEGNYSAESPAIYNLLQDLDGSYAADVAALGIAEWVTALREAEQEFLSLCDRRFLESAARPRGNIKNIRQLVDVLYQAILSILDARLLADDLGGDVIVDPESLKDGVYESDVPDHLRGNVVYNFVLAWNEEVKKYRNLLAQRKGRRAKANRGGEVED